MGLLALAALVAAADLPRPTVPHARSSAHEAAVTALGGVSVDAGSALALAELRHTAAAGGSRSLLWETALDGTLVLDGGGGYRYGEEVRAEVRSAAGLGGAAGVSIGGDPGWGAGELLGTYRRRFGPVEGEVRLGGAAHGEDGRAVAGGAVELKADVRLSQRTSAGTWVAARAWAGADVPALTAQGGAYVTGLALPAVRLTGAVGGRGSTASASVSASWAGLPAAGSSELWAFGRGTWSPRGPVALVAEVGTIVDPTGATEATGWLTGGVEARVGRIGVFDRPRPMAPFRLRAPDAATVAVAGSFNGWVAEPLSRAPGDVWELDRPIPAGTWEYVYIVDGKVVVPPEATRRVPDGLGGKAGWWSRPGSHSLDTSILVVQRRSTTKTARINL